MKIKTSISAGVQNPEIEIIVISKNTQLAEKIKNAAKNEIRRFSKSAGKEIPYKIISTQG